MWIPLRVAVQQHAAAVGRTVIHRNDLEPVEADNWLTTETRHPRRYGSTFRTGTTTETTGSVFTLVVRLLSWQ